MTEQLPALEAYTWVIMYINKLSKILYADLAQLIMCYEFRNAWQALIDSLGVHHFKKQNYVKLLK
jgi:hypothetical protein